MVTMLMMLMMVIKTMKTTTTMMVMSFYHVQFNAKAALLTLCAQCCFVP